MFIDGFIRFNDYFSDSEMVEAGSISLVNLQKNIVLRSHVGCFDNSYGGGVQLGYWDHK